MKVDLNINTQLPTPSLNDFSLWVSAALRLPAECSKDKETNQLHPKHISVAIEIMDTAPMHQLNLTYRKKDKPTNVLSFPYEPIPGEHSSHLGDIAICAPVVIEEANAQHKDITAHWAHMTIHGVLHLVGYDHETDDDAAIMMPLEITILEQLGFSNPY